MLKNYFLYSLIIGFMVFNCGGNKSQSNDYIQIELIWKHQNNAIGDVPGKGEIQLSNKGSMQDKWHNIIKESSQIVIG